MRVHYVYILASRSGVLYVGMTNDLDRRIHEHRTARFSFAAAYRAHRLLYFEVVDGRGAAFARERQIKGWRRARKVALIERANPTWDDLACGHRRPVR